MSLNFLNKIRTTHFYCVITIFVLLLICWHCYKVQEGLTDEECNCNCDGTTDADGNTYDANGNLINGPDYDNSPVVKAIVKKNMMVDAYKKLMNHEP